MSQVVRYDGDRAALEEPYADSAADSPLRAVIVSDIHVGDQEPDWLRDYRVYETAETVERVATAAGCNMLGVGGDAIYHGMVEELLDMDFERVAVAVGDEDWAAGGWARTLTPSAQDELFADDRHEYGRIVSLTHNEVPYPVEIGHFPNYFKVAAHSQDCEWIGDEAEPHPLDEPKIAVHGEEHQPGAWPLKRSLKVSAGSSFRNYSIHRHVRDEFPERSLYVLHAGETVDLYHIDFDTLECYEHQTFQFDGDGFRDMTEDEILPPVRRFQDYDPENHRPVEEEYSENMLEVTAD